MPIHEIEQRRRIVEIDSRLQSITGISRKTRFLSFQEASTTSQDFAQCILDHCGQGLSSFGR